MILLIKIYIILPSIYPSFFTTWLTAVCGESIGHFGDIFIKLFIIQYSNIVEHLGRAGTSDKMGTSMSYSSKQKHRIQFRNRAIPRSKIPQHMEKYYRYKQELIKNKETGKLKNQQILKKNDDLGKISPEKSNQNISQHFIVLPNDIPSIDRHSDLMDSKPETGSDSHEYSRTEVCQGQYADQAQAKSLNGFFPVRGQQKYSNIQTQPIPQFQKVPQQVKQVTISHLPNNSKHQNSNKLSNKGSSSHKKSNGRPESESSHALSEIILQREAYYTINYEKFRDDIKEEGEECSIELKDRRLSEGVPAHDLKLKFSGSDELKNQVISSKKSVIICNQVAISQPIKQSIPFNSADTREINTIKKQCGPIISSIEKTFKAKPFNIILEINSNIDEPLFTNSLKPTPINISSLSKNAMTNYSNNNSESLSTNGRPRKLLYF